MSDEHMSNMNAERFDPANLQRATDDLKAFVRMQQENERLRAVLRALVSMTFSGMTLWNGRDFVCGYCGAAHPGHLSSPPEHAPDCPIVKAREALQAEGDSHG